VSEKRDAMEKKLTLTPVAIAAAIERIFPLTIWLAIILFAAAFSSAAFAQSATADSSKAPIRASSAYRLSVAQLCAKLSLEKVQKIMGKHYQRREKGEELFQECKYGDGKEKSSMTVRYFSLGSYALGKKDASWRKEIEGKGKGKVTERDGVLVGDRQGNGFGPLDTLWFKDKSGHPLYLTVNTGVTEDQALALAKAALN